MRLVWHTCGKMDNHPTKPLLYFWTHTYTGNMGETGELHPGSGGTGWCCLPPKEDSHPKLLRPYFTSLSDSCWCLCARYAAVSLCLFKLLSCPLPALKLWSQWPHCFEQTLALTDISLCSQSLRSKGQFMWSQCCRRSSTSSISALPRTTYSRRSLTSFLSFWSRCLMHTSLLSQPSLQVSMKTVPHCKIVGTITCSYQHCINNHWTTSFPEEGRPICYTESPTLHKQSTNDVPWIKEQAKCYAKSTTAQETLHAYVTVSPADTIT